MTILRWIFDRIRLFIIRLFVRRLFGNEVPSNFSDDQIYEQDHLSTVPIRPSLGSKPLLWGPGWSLVEVPITGQLKVINFDKTYKCYGIDISTDLAWPRTLTDIN